MSASRSSPFFTGSPPKGLRLTAVSSAELYTYGAQERPQSPAWEEEDREHEGSTNSLQNPFGFKHFLPSERKDSRQSQRKQRNLEKFLTSVKKSSRLSQFDALPFRKLSSSKKYQGVIHHQPTILGYFQKDFEIIERLGFGDFAEVFKVKWKLDGGIYAVKRSISRFGSCFENEHPLQEQLRWMDEAFYHSAISGHPNIVECVQSWEEAGYFHIQMEYIPQGLDLFAEQGYPLSETVLWDILTDLLMALEHLHGSGYIHLDIKPENCFRDAYGVTKLGDFGLIAMIDADHKESGDPRYMPVAALEPDTLGYAVDIFSLGITMLELCTDLRLEANGPEWAALREIKWPPEVTNRIPASMRQIIRQMMSRDPRLRPSAASLLRFLPLRVHAMKRKMHFFNIPLLRLKDSASDFVKSVATTSSHWLRSWWPAGQPVERPLTPVADASYIDYAMKYDFTASVPRIVSQDSFTASLQRVSERTEKPTEEFKRNEEDFSEKELLSKSFVDMLDSEEEVDDRLKSKLFDNAATITQNLLDELSLISDDEECGDVSDRSGAATPGADHIYTDKILDQMNKVHVLPDLDAEESGREL